MELVFNILKDDGIGGDRSAIGRSFRKVAVEEFLDFNMNGKCFLTLSITIPSLNDLAKDVFYEVVQRGGRRTYDGRLKFVRALAEGTISDTEILGDIVNLNTNSEFPVLRYGKSFTISISDNYLIENIC